MSKGIQRILVSQPVPQNPRSPYFQLSEQYGVEFVFKPFFKVKPISTRAFRDQKIDILDHSAVIFTSRTLVDHLFGILKGLRITLPDDFKYFCNSEVVSAYLQKYITVRKRKVFYPGKGTFANDFNELLLKYPKERFLIPSTKEFYDEELYALLESKEIKYSRIVLSETINEQFTEEEIKSFDMIIFFSPKGILSLQENLPDYKQGKQLIGCLGDKTEIAIKEAGLRVDLMAPTDEFTSIGAALEHFLEKHQAK